MLRQGILNDPFVAFSTGLGRRWAGEGGHLQGMIFPCSQAEGNELPADLLLVPAQPKNTWKWLGSKGGKTNLQFMGFFTQGNREISLAIREGLENGVNQPETFQIWCNCVAVTQESRGLPP